MNKKPASKFVAHKNKLLKGFTLSVICLAFVQACATPSLHVDYESKSNFNIENYKTFEIKSLVSPPHPYVELINQGITNTLSNKGLKPAKGADLVVLYDVNVDKGSRLHDEEIPVNNMVYTRMTVEAVFDAKILVNVVDVKTNKVMWKATSTRDLTQVDPKKFNQEKANTRMSEIFEDFPSR